MHFWVGCHSGALEHHERISSAASCFVQRCNTRLFFFFFFFPSLFDKESIELHGLLFDVQHSERWQWCFITFIPEFVAKTRKTCVRDFIFKGVLFHLSTTLWVMMGLRFMLLVLHLQDAAFQVIL